MQHFHNDHLEFDVNPFKKKSRFNPKVDAAIEMYMGWLEEEILSLDEKISDSNLTKGEKNACICYMMIPPLLKKKLTKDQPWQYRTERII